MNLSVAQLETKMVDSEAQALMQDVNVNITESPGANFLFLPQGRMCIPDCRQALEGVRMEVVLGLSEQLGIKCEEWDFTPHDLYKGDEAFLTTIPYCLVPMVAVNNMPIVRWVPGQVANKLLHA
jgi:branched-subunit amino acid aminotransferase/4-amino-4-deoxychorismate lyase